MPKKRYKIVREIKRGVGGWGGDKREAKKERR